MFDHLRIPTLEAVDFIADVFARDKSSRLKRRTPEPIHQATSFPYEGAENPADLYRPATPVRCGILMVPGVAALGKDDPRLVALAKTMARLGFAVLIPELATIRQLNVRPNHRQIVAAGFAHLRSNPEWAPGGRAGIGGMSFAMGPGVLSALEPSIREDVRFVFCVGGYYDLVEEIRYVTTGAYRERGGPQGPGPWQHLTPDHYGRWVLASSLADRIEDDTSRMVLRRMIERRVPDVVADIEDLRPLVRDPAAIALLNLTENERPEAYDELLAALPPAMHADIASMDVAKVGLGTLRARLILIHGFDDTLVPHVESLALHRAAPKGQSAVYIIRGLAHVNLDRPKLMDAWRMLSAMTALLAERG